MNIDLSKTQKYLDWMKTKLYLDAISKSTVGNKFFRGEVYWCHFGINIGSEMSKETERPCVIVQNDIANINSPNVIVVPITHDCETLPCVIPINTLYNDDNSIKLDGNANVSNIVCVSKSRLIGNCITKLTTPEMKLIDEAIAKQLNLMIYYSKLNKRIKDKNEYINKIKNDRNKAQDLLNEIRIKLNAKNVEDILNKINNIVDK